ncbi:MAG: collagen binding domain-containing protein, partial [Oscillospiraceae bacterium]
ELEEAAKISTDDGGVEEDSSSSTDTSSGSSSEATTITIPTSDGKVWETSYSHSWEYSGDISFNATAAGSYELKLCYQAQPSGDGGKHQFQVKVNGNALYVDGKDYWDEDIGWNDTYKTFTVNLNAGNNTLNLNGQDVKYISAVFTPISTSATSYSVNARSTTTTQTTTQTVDAVSNGSRNNSVIKVVSGTDGDLYATDGFIKNDNSQYFKVGLAFNVDDISSTTTYEIKIYAKGQGSPEVKVFDSNGKTVGSLKQSISDRDWSNLKSSPTTITATGSDFSSTGTYYAGISANEYVNLYRVEVTETKQVEVEDSSSQAESSSQATSSSQADSSSQSEGDLTINISEKTDGTYEYVPYITVTTYGSLDDLNGSTNATGTHKYYLYDINNAAYEINGIRYTAAQILNGNAGTDIKYRKLATNQYMFFGSDGTPLEPIVNISTVSSGIGTIQLVNNPAQLENAIFSVKKVDSVNQSTGLAGAEFKLYVGENSGGTCLATLTTDSNGAITASTVEAALKAVKSSYSDYIDDAGCLKPAYVSGSSESGDLVLGDQKYCLVETVAPNGYQGTHLNTAIVFTVHPTQDSSTKKWTSTVQSSGVSDWCTFNSSTFEFTVLNDKVPSADFKLKKVGDDGSTILSGAKFVLKASDGTVLKTWDPFDGNEVLISTVTDTTKSAYVDSDGKLKEGSYILTEESAPTGYNKLSGDITIAVDSNGNITITPNSNDSSLVNVSSDTIKVVTVTNKLKTGRIKVAKKWLDSNGNNVIGSDGNVKDLDSNNVGDLTINIYRKVGDTKDDSFSRTVTLNSSNYDSSNKVWAASLNEDLPITNANGETYTYYVEEVLPSGGNFNGYNSENGGKPTYSYSDGTSSNADGISLIEGTTAQVEVTITNKEPLKVTLPETGGMGRTIPYIIGALIAMLSATALVIKQHRSNSNKAV